MESKIRNKVQILKINKLAMELLQANRYEKWLKNIDKANHLIEFYFPFNKQSIVGKNPSSYVNLVYRYQLISVTYNNWAWLYKQRGKLMHALKCLYQALKADKDLNRLFQKISEIKVNRSFDTDEDEKVLNELKMTNVNRNDFASTYLNIWAVLSLMGNHDKALHMSQKAIEIITNQAITKVFTISDFIDKLIGSDNRNMNDEKQSLLVTLAASFYNKSVELDFLQNANPFNNEYLILSLDAIEAANIAVQRIPEDTKITLKDEITKLYGKLQYK